MSFLDDLNRFAQGLVKSLKSEEVLKLKSCKACNFYKRGYCTQTSPPTRILSEYYAQGCIYYTPEQAVTGLETEIAKVKEQPVYVKGIKGIESRVLRRWGTIGHATPYHEETLCDIPNKQVILHSIDVGTDHDTVSLNIYPYKENGDLEAYPIGICDYDGDSFFYLCSRYVHLMPTADWEDALYDDTNDRYKFSLKNDLVFANGIKINIRNPNAIADQKVAVQAVVKIEGE